MKNYIRLSFFVLICSLPIYSQEKKTIYEIGKPLTSCECNFENLFANWGPRFVTNHDSIEWVSFRFVETLSDTARIASFVREFCDPKGIFSTKKGKNEYHQDTQQILKEFRIYPYFLKPRSDIPEDISRAEIQAFRQRLTAFLRIGDKVFSIKFRYGDKEYVFDAVCRPGENRIITDKMELSDIVEL